MIYFCGMEIRSFRTLPSFCLPRSCSSESLEGQVCDSFGLRLGNHTFFGGCGSWFLGPRSWRVANLSMKDPSVLQLFMGNPHTQWRFLDGKIMENHQTTSWWIFRCEVGIPVWSKIKNHENRGGKEVFAGDPAVSWNWHMQRDKMYVPTSCFTVPLGCFIGCPFKEKKGLFLRGKCSPKKSVHFWRLQARMATRTRTFHWLRLGTIPPSERDTQRAAKGSNYGHRWLKRLLFGCYPRSSLILVHCQPSGKYCSRLLTFIFWIVLLACVYLIGPCHNILKDDTGQPFWIPRLAKVTHLMGESPGVRFGVPSSVGKNAPQKKQPEILNDLRLMWKISSFSWRLHGSPIEKQDQTRELAWPEDMWSTCLFSLQLCHGCHGGAFRGFHRKVYRCI